MKIASHQAFISFANKYISRRSYPYYAYIIAAQESTQHIILLQTQRKEFISNPIRTRSTNIANETHETGTFTRHTPADGMNPLRNFVHFELHKQTQRRAPHAIFNGSNVYNIVAIHQIGFDFIYRPHEFRWAEYFSALLQHKQTK